MFRVQALAWLSDYLKVDSELLRLGFVVNRFERSGCIVRNT
jgi:hypothetical protein